MTCQISSHQENIHIHGKLFFDEMLTVALIFIHISFIPEGHLLKTLRWVQSENRQGLIRALWQLLFHGKECSIYITKSSAIKLDSKLGNSGK